MVALPRRLADLEPHTRKHVIAAVVVAAGWPFVLKLVLAAALQVSPNALEIVFPAFSYLIPGVFAGTFLSWAWRDALLRGVHRGYALLFGVGSVVMLVLAPIAYLLCARKGSSAAIGIGWFLLLLLCLFAASGVSLMILPVLNSSLGGDVTWSSRL